MAEVYDQFLAYKTQLELEIWKNMEALQAFETSPFTKSGNSIGIMREQVEEIDHIIKKNLQEKASLTKDLKEKNQKKNE